MCQEPDQATSYFGSMNLFPETAQLEIVSIDILCESILKTRAHSYIPMITDRFNKLVKDIPMKVVSEGEVAKLFCRPLRVQQWTNNRSNLRQRISIHVQIIHGRLPHSQHKTEFKTYNPKPNKQSGRFNKTILASLPSWIADHPCHWDLYTPALMYA